MLVICLQCESKNGKIKAKSLTGPCACLCSVSDKLLDMCVNRSPLINVLQLNNLKGRRIGWNLSLSTSTDSQLAVILWKCYWLIGGGKSHFGVNPAPVVWQHCLECLIMLELIHTANKLGIRAATICYPSPAFSPVPPSSFLSERQSVFTLYI